MNMRLLVFLAVPLALSACAPAPSAPGEGAPLPAGVAYAVPSDAAAVPPTPGLLCYQRVCYAASPAGAPLPQCRLVTTKTETGLRTPCRYSRGLGLFICKTVQGQRYAFRLLDTTGQELHRFRYQAGRQLAGPHCVVESLEIAP